MLPDADSPQAWLRFARSDFFVAENKLHESMFETHCFHAQQCVEKCLKAMMVDLKYLPIPRTHDLSQLLNILSNTIKDIPEGIMESASLSLYAVESRYPGFDDPVTEEEWKEAIRTAKTVLNWATSEITSTENDE